MESLRAFLFIHKIFYMAKYQYTWAGYTMTGIVTDAERVKVVNWEIIESDMEETYFTLNGFVKLEIKTEVKNDGKKDITIKSKIK